MELSHVKKSIATLSLLAVAACGGNGAGASGPMPPVNGVGHAQSSILSRIVGVGDSLTAGYQSDGFFGQTGVPNPLYSGGQIPPGQENGWWALLVEQASSSSLKAAIDKMYNPAKSPLPLIKGPGLDNQIVPSSNAFQPFGQFKGTDACTYAHGFNQRGFGMRSSAHVRMNPNQTTVRDVGIPGLTLHEAVTLHAPQTDTCSPLPGIPGLLSDVVNEESGTYWPVLRNFSNLGGHITEVGAAASVHPTLATVWLGANDVLKYMGSGGRFVGGDNTVGQVSGDLQTAISTLKKSGARIVIANLPNILETGYFQRVTTPKHPNHNCAIRTYAYCFLNIVVGLPSNAVPQIARKYGLDTPNGCVPTSVTKPCGYLTLAAVTEIATYYLTYGNYPDLDCAVPSPSCKPAKGSGLGANYITPQFAAKVQSLNNTVNKGIDEAASSTGSPLVDVFSIFHGLASGNPSNPYFQLATSINPGVCCTLGYLHGILSFDGIHPSNSGYALIAYAFIETINKAYGTNIKQVDLTAAYNGTRCGNKNYCFPDPYAPH